MSVETTVELHADEALFMIADITARAKSLGIGLAKYPVDDIEKVLALAARPPTDGADTVPVAGWLTERRRNEIIGIIVLNSVGGTDDFPVVNLAGVIGDLDELTASPAGVTVGWRPIDTADRSTVARIDFPGVMEGSTYSLPVWCRTQGGKPFEASWVKTDRGKEYWWAWDLEDVVDPDQWMPHPLTAALHPTPPGNAQSPEVQG